MELEVQLNPLPGFPRLEGAHELAWSYLLDAIFADAYRAGVRRLKVVLPHPELQAGVELRSRLTPPSGASTALALLAPAPLGQAERIYTLEFGPLAPASLRRTKPLRPGKEPEQRLYVYTLRARLAGVGMRLPSPAASDRAWRRVRQSFASPQPAPSFYRLFIWGAS
ncbi:MULTISPECIES: hypothetical protein [unclassified Meiothermus]|uniref:hypothetical protein n=1 Tax=unclassified Meiothermus TaxID=370471 RepID=UPI000D7C54C6|nr:MULTISPECIES: hypothetical protein [unclassified Meiothermus]PZA06433.1 hypothetical protein DNA98_13735 [Meiothermus sp. Pnk-1]RYM36948.1 hypothetical protein EWH23_07595 [Meiothermus sp. PNK-Is4]